MRLNKFIAQASGISRRAADDAIRTHRVQVNGRIPELGAQVSGSDCVELDGERLCSPTEATTILFHKPVGYVSSRDGQGSSTIFELLPQELHSLKPVGRLDKNSSGLLLLTDNGDLAYELTHPSRQKTKVYEITINTALAPLHRQMINDFGVQLDDGPSRLQLERLADEDDLHWRVTMREGRNRQIRRTFAALGYHVNKLHRTHFGPYHLQGIAAGAYKSI